MFIYCWLSYSIDPQTIGSSFSCAVKVGLLNISPTAHHPFEFWLSRDRQSKLKLSLSHDNEESLTHMHKVTFITQLIL